MELSATLSNADALTAIQILQEIEVKAGWYRGLRFHHKNYSGDLPLASIFTIFQDRASNGSLTPSKELVDALRPLQGKNDKLFDTCCRICQLFLQFLHTLIAWIGRGCKQERSLNILATLESQIPAVQPIPSEDASPPLASPIREAPSNAPLANMEQFCLPVDKPGFETIKNTLVGSSKPFHCEMIKMLTAIDEVFALPESDARARSLSLKNRTLSNISRQANECEYGWHSTIAVEYFSLCQPDFDKCIDFFVEGYIQQAFNGLQVLLDRYRRPDTMEFHINGVYPIVEAFASTLNLTFVSPFFQGIKHAAYKDYWAQWLAKNRFVALNKDEHVRHADYTYLWPLFLINCSPDDLKAFVRGSVNEFYNQDLRSHLLSILTSHLDDAVLAKDDLYIEVFKDGQTVQYLTDKAIDRLTHPYWDALTFLHMKFGKIVQGLIASPDRIRGLLKSNYASRDPLTNRDLFFYFRHLQRQYPALHVMEHEMRIEITTLLKQVDIACTALAVSPTNGLQKHLMYPLYVNGNHWVFVFVDYVLSKVEYYDSKAGQYTKASVEECLANVAALLSRKTGKAFTVEYKLPKVSVTGAQCIQPDGFHCGDWVAWFAESRVKQGPTFDPSGSTEDMDKFRANMKHILMENIVTGVEAIPDFEEEIS